MNANLIILNLILGLIIYASMSIIIKLIGYCKTGKSISLNFEVFVFCLLISIYKYLLDINF